MNETDLKLILHTKRIVEKLSEAQDEAYNAALEILDISTEKEDKFFDYIYNQGPQKAEDFIK